MLFRGEGEGEGEGEEKGKRRGDTSQERTQEWRGGQYRTHKQAMVVPDPAARSFPSLP